MDDAQGAGDLHVDVYRFQIGEYGYAPYFGPGFNGTFDSNTLAVWVNGTQIVSPTQSMPRFEESATVSPTGPKHRFDESTNVTAPVPEPMTWALMIAGFGLAGTALRTRKRVQALA
jgi:hypothetical protein